MKRNINGRQSMPASCVLTRRYSNIPARLFPRKPPLTLFESYGEKRWRDSSHHADVPKFACVAGRKRGRDPARSRSQRHQSTLKVL